jgi:hypothetical protein
MVPLGLSPGNAVFRDVSLRPSNPAPCNTPQIRRSCGMCAEHVVAGGDFSDDRSTKSAAQTT